MASDQGVPANCLPPRRDAQPRGGADRGLALLASQPLTATLGFEDKPRDVVQVESALNEFEGPEPR